MNKKLVTTGLAAGLLAGTGAGLILQMSGSAGAATGSVTAAVTVEGDGTDNSLPAADAAADATRPDPSARLQEVLQPLVTDGTLNQAQLDKVVETLVAAGPMGGGHGGPMGDGPMGGGRQGGPGGGRGLATVAETLGMTEAEIRDAVSNGQTLAQLAEAKGSSAQALIDAIVADAKSHLDEEVASGEHTQADADAKLAEITTRVTEMVNNTPPLPMGGPGGRPGHPGDDADAVTVTTQG